MSVPLQLITYEQAEAAFNGRHAAGRAPQVAAFTLRIRNSAEVLVDLEQTFGLSSRSLFPDVPGLAAYGASFR